MPDLYALPDHGPMLPFLPGCTGHGVCFYLKRDFLVRNVYQQMLPVLQDGHGGMIIATPATVNAMKLHAAMLGTDFEAARSSGRLMILDADLCLQRFMLDDMPDPVLFNAFIGGQLLYLGYRFPHLHLYGEMVGVLCARGQFAAAVRLEQLWNAMATERAFDLLCGSPMELFEHAAHAPEMEAIRQAHTYTVRH